MRAIPFPDLWRTVGPPLTPSRALAALERPADSTLDGLPFDPRATAIGEGRGNGLGPSGTSSSLEYPIWSDSLDPPVPSTPGRISRVVRI